ncbi:hypothetical protein PATA110616_13560 [Paenibacillus tarimensis]
MMMPALQEVLFHGLAASPFDKHWNPERIMPMIYLRGFFVLTPTLGKCMEGQAKRLVGRW